MVRGIGGGDMTHQMVTGIHHGGIDPGMVNRGIVMAIRVGTTMIPMTPRPGEVTGEMIDVSLLKQCYRIQLVMRKVGDRKETEVQAPPRLVRAILIL